MHFSNMKQSTRMSFKLLDALSKYKRKVFNYSMHCKNDACIKLKIKTEIRSTAYAFEFKDHSYDCTKVRGK